MANIIVGLLIAVAVAAALGYIIRSKKKGGHCIGCPNAAACPGGCAHRSPEGDSSSGG